MKKLILVIFSFLTLSNCSVKEKPEFIGLENIKISDANNITVQITADATFNNPNDIGGKLSTESIKVYVNDVEMATLLSDEFKVPAKEHFSIPLEVKIPTDSIISNKSIAGLLGSLLTQKLKVQYKGDIKYKVIGFSHKYKIDKTETIKIKL
ncbi:LEA type 2 family protein [Ichthyenterobacterium sp. W332]|uniref:LEA type 2 family protein n=1 Tax=Microcosmobacter mediterraneus TaxID=3075607 RepID=A0ABU2YH78_9FLAO|nr:LEA type 2 family protein [Ichthyenterobacterium sp. W332]MDT0557525.1 LEA type 2 family protein [Ichthyenterobacterium sp. W332]